VEGILLRDVRPFTPLTHLIIDGFNSRLSLYATAIRDPRFDALTPPESLFKRQPIGVIFQFYDQVFATLYPNGDVIAQEYSPHFFPVIESLETGVMTRDCAFLLKKTVRCPFRSGCVLCKCVDHRFTPFREVIVKLEVGGEVVQYFLKGSSTEELLESEAGIVKLRRPIICTDPSPEVARIQSALDFRKKMWIARKQRTQTEDVARTPPAQKAKEAPRGVKIGHRRSTVKVSEELIRLCAQYS
jgi:hypothetical protein